MLHTHKENIGLLCFHKNKVSVLPVTEVFEVYDIG